ncbi:MAG TPA: H-X9-DG-CTERM domain-containing protein, partial [Phycisphaerae bacterium]|nr:H-X9-DG-CTERM domain-containing protein [Phycisphaerae bacterium]
MSHRLRGVDVAVTVVVLVAAAGVGAALVGTVATDSQQARCAANLGKFGEALAAYEAQWGEFPPCDPFLLMPSCPPGDPDPALRRSYTRPEQCADPPHGRLLYAMGYVPSIDASFPFYAPWYQEPYGFRIATEIGGRDCVPPPAICPSAVLDNVMDPQSPELDPWSYEDAYPILYKYAACYMVNRILRSPTDHGRWPVRPDDEFEDDFFYDGPTDNIWGRAETRLDAGSGVRNYHVQAINSDEVLAPGKVVYLCDSLDYCTDDSSVEPPFGALGAGRQSAGMWYMQRGGTPPGAVILGSRHNGKANALYADGHISDDGQTVRNRRGQIAIASTFSDFTVENNLGNQHYTLPCGPYMDATAPGGGAPAPGDDEPPTVTAVWPGDEGASSPNATHITITFSEQVLINTTAPLSHGFHGSSGTQQRNRSTLMPSVRRRRRVLFVCDLRACRLRR